MVYLDIATGVPHWRLHDFTFDTKSELRRCWPSTTMKFNVPESPIKGPIEEIPDVGATNFSSNNVNNNNAELFSAYQEIRVQLPIDFRLPQSIPKRPLPPNAANATTTSTNNDNNKPSLVPPFRIHGYNWILNCFESAGPTGGAGGGVNNDFVAIQMQLAEPPPLPAKLRGRFIFAIDGYPMSTKILTATALTTEKVWGLDKFISQRALRDYATSLCDGRITIVVRISISSAHIKPPLFQPQLHSGGHLLLDEIMQYGTPRTFIVTFVVVGNSSSDNKEEEESCCTMHLPATLCEQRLPQLVALLQQNDKDENDGDDADENNNNNQTKKEAVQIDGLIVPMTMDAFRLFLSIALTGLPTTTTTTTSPSETTTTTSSEPRPREEITRSALQLLDLADRFGFVELKLYMEGHLVMYHLVDVESALYLLAIAHSRHCLLLKECCMDYINSPHIFATAVASRQWAEVVEAAPELHRDLYRRLGVTQAHSPALPRSMSALYKESEQRSLSLEGTRQQLEDRLLLQRQQQQQLPSAS
jgi:hypothetical protein